MLCIALSPNQIKMKHPGIIQLTKELYAAQSLIHESGLYSAGTFKKGTRLFTVKGIDVPRIKKVNRWVDASTSILGTHSCNPIVYLNHSCEPNVVIKADFNIEAIRPIKKNQEILIDYSTIEDDSSWKMPCSCGNFNCRKVIRSFNHLPDDVKAWYSNYIPQRIMMHIPLFKK